MKTLSAIALIVAPSVAFATTVMPLQTATAKSDGTAGVIVSNAWARPALKGGTGGAYLTITNKSGRVIRVVSAVCGCANSAELHVSSVHNGMAHMEMLPRLIVTPGASVSLKPGGVHFMLVGLRQAFVKGDSTRLALRLEDGSQIVVNVAIRIQ